MTTLLERVFARHDINEVRTAWIARVRREAHRVDPEAWLVGRGYERVNVAVGVLMTDDGREVLRLDGQPWSLRPEVHAARVREAMDAATARAGVPKTEPAAEPVTEGIDAATCPQMVSGRPCGGTINRAGVCPSCVTGRMGYRYRYTCESCGCDIVTREALK